MVFEDFVSNLMTLLDNWAFRLMFILVILALTSVVAKIFNFLVKRYFHHTSHHLNIDKTRFSVMSKLITAIIYFIGVIAAGSTIPGLRTVSLSLLTGAGVLAAILGFASQQAVSNVINGVFIAMFKPFRVGDRIQIGTDIGDVEDITLRHTVIRNFENKRLIIPNGIIGNEKIINYSIEDPKIRSQLDYGISYDSDIDKAMKIIKDEVTHHPLWVDVRSEDQKKSGEAAVDIYVMGFGDSSINLRAYAWTSDPRSSYQLKSDLNISIKKRFDKEGLEIPYQYRTIVYKTDLKRRKK